MGLCRSLSRKTGKNVLVRFSKLQFNCPEVHDSWKNIAFGNLLIFFSNSDPEKILYERFVVVFRQLRQNSNPIVHRHILNKKGSLFAQNPFFSYLRTLTDAFLNTQRKHFCQFCQYGIQRIQKNDWMKFLSYKELELFYHLRTLNEKSLEFLPETSSQLSKLFLGV